MSALQRSLESIEAKFKVSSLGVLERHAQALQAYRDWCTQSLARQHLVKVASLFHRKYKADENQLEILGIPLDVLALFPKWKSGSTAGFRPKSLGLHPRPYGAGQPLGSLRLQLSPHSETIPYSLMLIRDLLRRTDPDVLLWVVVEPGANLDGLRDLSRNFHASAARRVRFVEGKSTTIFAQDNARAALDEDGQAVLLIPREFSRGQSRQDDELSIDLARKQFGLPVLQSMFFWEGGNLLDAGPCCLIGVDSVGENMRRLGLRRQEVIQGLSAELGCEVVPVGDLSKYHHKKGKEPSSGQASFHLDLDISLLGRQGRQKKPRALIADPARGLDFLPAVLAKASLFRDHFVPPGQAKDLIEAEYDSYAHDRHPKLLAYCDLLESLGFHVVGVPDLRIDPKENLFKIRNFDFSYCNVLPGLRNGRPAVHYLPWGIRELDLDAEKQFRLAGLQPVKISKDGRIGNALMRWLGGLHCFCGPLR